MVAVMERETIGVLHTKKNGRLALHCGRCVKARGEGEIALFLQDKTFLIPHEQNWGWNKKDGVYDAQRGGRLSHKPAPGSRIRCRVCQWVNTVPEPED